LRAGGVLTNQRLVSPSDAGELGEAEAGIVPQQSRRLERTTTNWPNMAAIDQV
jgi:hypothetical protein